MRWLLWAVTAVGSSIGTLKIIDYLIQWRNEKRTQAAEKTTAEMNRPRFRIDITEVPTSHSAVTTAIVKILSLGRLPLTIDDGEVFIEAGHYPEKVQRQQIQKTEISSVRPIEFRFSLPQKLINPSGIGKSIVKMVCKFSHSGRKQTEHYEALYDHQKHGFLNPEQVKNSHA